jgi:hypothetical protein
LGDHDGNGDFTLTPGKRVDRFFRFAEKDDGEQRLKIKVTPPAVLLRS